MKKIVVMSDSHGNHGAIDEVRLRETGADYYVHCGDVEGNDELLKGWVCVRGNNDWSSTLSREVIFEADGIRFLVAHGDQFGYFNRNELMVEALKKNNCNVLLFGHSHVPEKLKVSGYYLINPGSVTLPRRGSEKGYCVISLDNGNIGVEFKKL